MSETTLDDDELVGAALNGDKAAFSGLIRRHHVSMKLLAFNITRDNSSAEDVLQDSYIKAYRSLPKFNRKSSFKTWISRIVYNSSIDEVRRSKRNATDPMGDIETMVSDAVGASNPDPVDRLDIDRAFAQLPVEQRVAVLLVDGQGFGYNEAARALDIPPGTLAGRVRLGRAALRQALALEGGLR